MIRRSIDQRGETIMEVLICVAVVGFMMTAAFALSNRNQAHLRASQERSSAVTIAESQLEKLRNYADVYNLPVANAALPGKGVFCVTDSNTIAPLTGVIPQNAKLEDGTSLSKYPAACLPTSAGDYRIAIWPPGTNSNVSSAGGNRYLVTARWVSPTGDGIDQIDMYYEVYDTNNPAYAAAAPSPACGDRIDNDGDGKIDAAGYNSPTGFNDAAGFHPAGFYPADAGCNGSITGASEVNAACNNKDEPSAPNAGDDDGDGKKDYPADPGCTSYTDNDEADPPTIQPFDWSVDGKDFVSCVATEAQAGDGNDGCIVPGGQTYYYMRRQSRAHYTGSTVKPGTATLVIKYRQWAGTSAPTTYAGYQMQLKGLGGDVNFTMPTGTSGTAMTYTSTVTTSSTPSSISLEWLNNIGSDPDLQIDSIRIYR